MALLHEEAEQMFEASQQIDALREIIVTDLENESLGVTVHTEHILEGDDDPKLMVNSKGSRFFTGSHSNWVGFHYCIGTHQYNVGQTPTK